jgi:hypothetical protein
MVEKQTVICDVCDEHVAKCKCEICSKDICEDCTNEVIVMLNTETALFSIDTCERCRKQFSRVCLSKEHIFEEVFKDKPEIKQEIVEVIKNVMMLHKISDEDIKEEEEQPSKGFGVYPKPLIFPTRPYPSPYNNPKWKKWYSNHR